MHTNSEPMKRGLRNNERKMAMRNLIHASNLITSWLLENTNEVFEEIPEVDEIHSLIEEYIQKAGVVAEVQEAAKPRPAAVRAGKPKRESRNHFDDCPSAGIEVDSMAWHILKALYEDGPATDDRVATRIDRVHQSVSACRWRLADDGLVVNSGEKAETQRGWTAIVWELTPAGRACVLSLPTPI